MVQFRALDRPRLKAVMKRAAVVDLRNVYLPEKWLPPASIYDAHERA